MLSVLEMGEEGELGGVTDMVESRESGEDKAEEEVEIGVAKDMFCKASEIEDMDMVVGIDEIKVDRGRSVGSVVRELRKRLE